MIDIEDYIENDLKGDELDDLHDIRLKHVKSIAPDRCKDCEELTVSTQDDTFSVPARFSGDRVQFGSVNYVPFCMKKNDFI